MDLQELVPQKLELPAERSRLKRNSKFINHSSRKNDKKRKTLMLANFGKDEKEQLKNKSKRRKKEMCDNLKEY